MSPDQQPKPVHTVPAWPGPLSITRVAGGRRVEEAGIRGRVVLVVSSTVYSAISTKVERFRTDLQFFGYTADTYQFVSGTPEDLRACLAGLYSEPASLVGAILIGEIPYIIYEMMQDWDGVGGDPPEYDDFPCDLFYMDLNGTWQDVLEDGSVHAGNGKYDTRSGDLSAEIWTSRMRTANLTSLGGEADLLNHYLDKDHSYRSGTLPRSSTALVYDDDDWASMSSADSGYVARVYGSGSVTTVDDNEATTAADYKTYRMPTNQELVFLRSHGYPGGHGFYRAGKSIFEYVFCSDYRTLLPPALFYSLYVCSGCDFSTANYFGGTAAFNTNTGLLVWGASKTGGMWLDDYFYQCLENGDGFGLAFRKWFNWVQSTYPSYAPSWWYGQVLLGDGTLYPAPLGGPLAVGVTGLRAEATARGVSLTWETANEVDLDGFLVLRAEHGDTTFEPVSPEVIPAQGRSDRPHAYAFTDRSARPGRVYRYRIGEVTTTGRQRARSAGVTVVTPP
jgi:hypothetical protein